MEAFELAAAQSRAQRGSISAGPSAADHSRKMVCVHFRLDPAVSLGILQAVRGDRS